MVLPGVVPGTGHGEEGTRNKLKTASKKKVKENRKNSKKTTSKISKPGSSYSRSGPKRWARQGGHGRGGTHADPSTP